MMMINDDDDKEKKLFIGFGHCNQEQEICPNVFPIQQLFQQHTTETTNLLEEHSNLVDV